MKKSVSLKIHKNPTDLCNDLFEKDRVKIEEGTTILVGCNGYGKTTLINEIKRQIKNRKDAVIFSYSDCRDGREAGIERAMFYGDIDSVASAIVSSEGEKIVQNFGRFVGDIGRRVRNKESFEELWIFIDGSDSGTSIDRIIEIKEFFDLLIDDNAGKNVFVIVSVNQYEYTVGRRCLDVERLEYVEFKDYEEYRAFILETRQRHIKKFNV